MKKLAPASGRRAPADAAPGKPIARFRLEAMPPKARGELAEARFVAKAMALGITVSKPFGDSAKYDFLIDAGGKLSRVQVKSAWVKSGKGYQVMAGPGCHPNCPSRRKYRRNEIDFLLAYLAPEDAWFVFPITVLRRTYVRWNPQSQRRLAQYREAWQQLFGREAAGR